jgi:hypothetical protein
MLVESGFLSKSSADVKIRPKVVLFRLLWRYNNQWEVSWHESRNSAIKAKQQLDAEYAKEQGYISGTIRMIQVPIDKRDLAWWLTMHGAE